MSTVMEHAAPTTTTEVVLDGAKLADALSLVSLAVSTDKARPILTAVNVERTDAGVQLTATNTYVLARQVVDLGAGYDLAPFEPFMLPGELVKPVLSGLKQAAGKAVRISVDAANVTVSLPSGSTCVAPRVLGEFPQIDQILVDASAGTAAAYKTSACFSLTESTLPFLAKLAKRWTSLCFDMQDDPAKAMIVRPTNPVVHDAGAVVLVMPGRPTNR